MNLLVDLTLRGSLATLVVVALDRVFSGSVSARSRRLWWVLVPVAFFCPVRIPVLPSRVGLDAAIPGLNRLSGLGGLPGADAGGSVSGHPQPWAVVWVAGAILYLALVVVQTVRISRRCSRQRLSTDHGLLELLEDCKQESGVTAPIGLVVSAAVPSPLILGWLRPRILLPADLAASMSRDRLRAILLHELAHFRSLDVPFNWLLTAVRTVHWFNPIAYLAHAEWARFGEEAADESAVRGLRDPSGQAYGEALLQTLRQSRDRSVPFGALAIVESVHHLKRRITMITNHGRKSSRALLSGLAALVIAACIVSKPVHAAGPATPDPKAEAVAAMETWLKEIDGGQYDQSWKDASGRFQKAVSTEKWAAVSNRVRTPLGRCTRRSLMSAALMKDMPGPKGTVLKGDFVMAQFATSFENLYAGIETVVFERESDGRWRVSGYFIKPA